jgi:hypothetical protein
LVAATGRAVYKDVHIKLRAKAKAIAKCINPGGNEPPGQNPVILDEVKVSGTDWIPSYKIKDGKVTFSVHTKAPPKRVFGAPDCPNKNWKETLEDLRFKKATLTIKQEGKKDLDVRCTFDKPTDDGPVPKKNFTCRTD